jgi:hypothetical protein
VSQCDLADHAVTDSKLAPKDMELDGRRWNVGRRARKLKERSVSQLFQVGKLRDGISSLKSFLFIYFLEERDTNSRILLNKL